MPNYPYTSSGQAAIVQTFSQLRRGFPNKVDAGYLQRFNIAPANESYVISILRFLGLIDEDGNRVEDKTGYFFGDDDSFKSGLEDTVRRAYSQVFEEMGDGALDIQKDSLIHWFRISDKTSALVGRRQATAFQTLAALAGHGEIPADRSSAAKKTATTTPGVTAKKTAATTQVAAARKSTGMKATPVEKPVEDHANRSSKNGHDVGLTVRIEVNLPPGCDADTYDAIFASIKKHLMS